MLADRLGSGRTIGEALQEYARLRMPKARRIVNTAWRYGKIAHLRSRWRQRLRNLAMKNIPDWVSRKRVEWLYKLNY